ncbi:ATPase PAAT isoform X3 [Colossoma macropomum]|uniref:ATPase PAAT isoform X3 n=1 Tax=Colossoma macropomum TaxID=42526 RepID=UPI001864631C|nr:ATPase PAAT isoform X3 [Colossoma macropomum]
MSSSVMGGTEQVGRRSISSFGVLEASPSQGDDSEAAAARRMSVSKGAVVSGISSWVCSSSSQLSDIISTLTESDEQPAAQCEPVCLERAEEGSPCVITLLCNPNSGAVISRVVIVSEARTIEVYSLSGDYCGTCRGDEDQRWQSGSSAEERKPFYRCQLVLESPLASCEVKLLSLGGRSAVGVAQVTVGLQFLQATHCPLSASPGIDLQRVQAMMEQMGTTLSPGAQNLMEMVQFQQKNKADVLGGFLPLLMGGGALACLAKSSPFSPDSAAMGELGSDGSAAPAGQNPESETHHPPSPSNQSSVPDAVSALLAAHAGQQSPVSPDLLPVLQSVCGQVTQLRLDAVNSPEKRRNGERDDHMCCGGLEKALERVVEKRMEELEKRLKEHMDLRLDALQRKLELTLQQALTHLPNPQ